MIDSSKNNQLLDKLFYTSISPEDTLSAAKELSNFIVTGDVIILRGALGAGKTTFVKGAIFCLCKVDLHEISSPTFTYMNAYEFNQPVYHFDLYRISNEEQILEMGLLDFINEGSICLVEWPEKSPLITSLATVDVEITYTSSSERLIKIQRLKK